jgi:hypothetical protein
MKISNVKSYEFDCRAEEAATIQESPHDPGQSHLKYRTQSNQAQIGKKGKSTPKTKKMSLLQLLRWDSDRAS